MNIKLCICVLLTVSLFARGEDLSQMERVFINLLQARSLKGQELSSIESRLSKLADRIDSAKKASQRDENLIRKLMASGIPISDSMATSKSQLNAMDRQIEEMQNSLAKLYKNQLDSLGNLLGKSNGNERTILTDRVELISQKYMLLNPAIRQLSFDPAKLQDIELSSIDDAVERDILSAFLNKSLDEVENRIEHIRSDLKEIEPFVKLNEKTREFLEEIDGDNFLLLGSTESSANALDEFQSGRFSGNDVVTTNYIEQNAFSIERLMKQLEISDFTLEKTIDNDGNTLQPHFTSSEYVKLLREIEDQLKSVRSEIRDRLNEVTP